MLWFTIESFYFKGMVERFDRENDWLEMSEGYAKVKKQIYVQRLIAPKASAEGACI